MVLMRRSNTTDLPKPKMPVLFSARRIRQKNTGDFRTLYYTREIVLKPPSVSNRQLIDDVKGFPVWQELRRSKTDLRNSIPGRAVDDDVNTERDEANNESRRPSGFSEIDFDLASFFAHTEVFRPKPGSKILQSKRRNVLLYSKIYNWRPKSVTYRNFFLPVIETRRSQDTPTNHIKY
ncbi:hypothetical protein LSH36_1027g01028 [Paralvinella palmiformis]|uniref:Uncharacterized protein n=1 Tax=Paralvinella palmiformis TaxID=53620 RepID=A0AAD9IWC0_9ANNE|nr:hypothetical protein LSH36_1027g01028 [Paralvinella palmiformis]